MSIFSSLQNALNALTVEAAIDTAPVTQPTIDTTPVNPPSLYGQLPFQVEQRPIIEPISITVGAITEPQAIFNVREGFNQVFGTNITNDVLRGKNGANNFIAGVDGRDVIFGGNRADEIYLGIPGVANGTGYGKIFAGAGNDTIYAVGDHHVIDGGRGNDSISIDGSHNLVIGGSGDDNIFTNYFTYFGKNNALGGNQTIDGGAGRDVIHVHGDQNIIYGGDDADIINTLGDRSQLYGGAGNDAISSVGTGNIADGGSGNDLMALSMGLNSTLIGGAGNDNLTLVSGSNNTLSGGAGNDYLETKDGQGNVLLGGAGNDTLVVNAAEWRGVVLIDGSLTTGTNDGDTTVINAPDAIIIGQIEEISIPPAPAPLIEATLTGGAGRDIFTFKTGFDLPGNNHISSNVTITDFDMRFDKLVLDSAVDGRGAISTIQFTGGDTILTLNAPTSEEKATITLVGIDGNEWARMNVA